MFEKKKQGIQNQNPRFTDSPAYRQLKPQQSANASKAIDPYGVHSNTVKKQITQPPQQQSAAPISTGVQNPSVRLRDSYAYQPVKPQQPASSHVAKPIDPYAGIENLNAAKAKSQSAAQAAMPSGQSKIPAHKNGSFFTMNAPNDTKRSLLVQELGKIQNAAKNSEMRGELMEMQKNVVHQLNLLDAAEGNMPRSYAKEDWTAAASGSVPESAMKPRKHVDTRQAYNDYLKEATTPSVEEYHKLQSLGSNMSFYDYAHQKLDAQTKSYSQFAYEMSLGKPDYRSYGDTAQKTMEAVNSIPDINALGAGGGMIRADKQRSEEIQSRYERNQAIEQSGLADWLDSTGHINGQAREGLGSMSFGPTIDERYSSEFMRDGVHKFQDAVHAYDFGSVANAGCEAIAAYNTLHDLGMDVSLSQIIYDTERNNDMVWNGWFGTNAYKVDDILKMYGVKSIVMNNPELIDSFSKRGGP